MITHTIEELERKIRNAGTLTPGQREELQTLVNDLKQEVVRLAETHTDAADSIVQFAGITAGEGLKADRNPKLVGIAVSGIRASVERFETSHPGLTLAVNNMATYFSNLGI